MLFYTLLFQTLKSSLRKKKEIPENKKEFKNNYKEKIKYYFKDVVVEDDILNGIIDIKNMDKTENKIYELIQNDLKKIVYNINSFDTNINKDLEEIIEQGIEQEIQTNKDFEKIMCYATEYHLNEKIYIDPHFLEKTKIHIKNNIFILLNLFSFKSTHNFFYIYSNFNYLLIEYMFILYKNELILINSTILPYIYDKYPILNINLILINFDLFNLTTKDIEFIKKTYNENNLLKILNSKNTDNTLLSSLSPIEEILVLNIFNTYDKKYMTNTQYNYYVSITENNLKSSVSENKLNSSVPENGLSLLNHLIKSKYDTIDEQYKLKINILSGGNKFNNIWYNKYIKYKLKYNELKTK